MRLEQHRFAAKEIYAPEAVFHVTDYCQPRRTVAPHAREGPVILGQNSPDDILIYVGAKDFIDLLCDSWAAKPRIASLHFANGFDNCLGWSFWTGFSFSLRRKEPAKFSFLERIVKLEQRPWADDDCYSVQSGALDKDGPEAQEKPIPSCEIGRSFSRTISDDELVPHC